MDPLPPAITTLATNTKLPDGGADGAVTLSKGDAVALSQLVRLLTAYVRDQLSRCGP